MDDDKELLKVQRAQSRAWTVLMARQMKALQVALAAREEIEKLEAAMTAMRPKNKPTSPLKAA
jgi:hypothetical protein